MSGKPRRHHFLPRFYLAGFTDSGSQDGALWVLDMQQQKQWRTTPKKAAHRRDYYRIDASGLEPQAIEKTFSELEGMAAGVIRNVVASEQLPKGDDLLVLLDCVALLWARVPHIRNTMAKCLDEIARKVIRMAVSSPEMYRGIVERMRKSGQKMPDGIDDYEGVKCFTEEGQYTTEVEQTWHVGQILRSMKTISPLLMRRNWFLLVAKEGEGSFVCSDSPVTITWTKDVHWFYGPGLVHKDTAVTLPLSSRVALRGEFADKPPVALPVPGRSVAWVNTLRVQHAERFIYSAQRDFLWMKSDGTVADTTALLTTLSQSRPNEGRDSGMVSPEGDHD